MKQFLAAFFGTVLGLVAFCAFVFFVLAGSVVLFGLLGSVQADRVEPGSYLVLNLDGVNLTDAPPPVEEGGVAWLLRGDAPRPVALRHVTEGLRLAAADARVAGVFLTGNFFAEGYGTGLAALGELRAAIEAFKASGKPVRAHFTELGIAELYAASPADELTLDPAGLVVLPGLASEPMFFADAFQKWGVGVQVTRSGKYKSAIEPFIRRDMSEESREQLTVLLSDLWRVVREGVAESRGLEPGLLQVLSDRRGLLLPEEALEAGLVTGLAHRDEVIEALRAATGVEAGYPFTQVSFDAYWRAVQSGRPKRGPAVAVVYLEGDIVDGEGVEGEVGGAAFSRELRALREDEEVAAVVLRVNSPGGSATAAEQIAREVRRLREVKPVVVSFGSYAASGGYWVATHGNRILAEPSTVTGSIGVFGVQFNVERLAGSVGVTWDRVQTSGMGGLLSAARPKTPAELAVFQAMVDHTYEAFLDRVSEGRGLPRAVAHAVAQGRVWSGLQAVELGLVDELGGLSDAIKLAARSAELPADARIVEYPRTRPFVEILGDLMTGEWGPETRARLVALVGRGPTLAWLRVAERQVRELGRYNDPRGVYARLPMEVRLR